MNIGDLLMGLKLDATSFLSSVNNALGSWESAAGKMSAASDTIQQGVDRLGQSFTGLEGSTSVAAGGVSALLDKWNSAAGIMAIGGASIAAAVTAPLVGLGQAALSLGSQLKTAEIGFTTMLGSGEKAMAFLDQLKGFAATTPFEFTELVQSAKRMMALGFEAEKVVPTLRAVGNAAALLGSGSAGIDRITLALGQMAMKGKVSAEEMRQLTEAGIGGWDILAKAVGVSVAEIQKMAEKGLIPAKDAVDALVAGMEARFGSGMDRLSKEAEGKFSNIKDTMGFILADIGKTLLPIASTVLDEFVKPVVDGLRVLSAGFASLSEPVRTAIVAVAGLAAAVGPGMLALAGVGKVLASIVPLLAPIASGFASLGPAIASAAVAAGPLLPVLAGIAAIIGTGFAIDAALTQVEALDLRMREAEDALVKAESAGGTLQERLGILTASLAEASEAGRDFGNDLTLNAEAVKLFKDYVAELIKTLTPGAKTAMLEGADAVVKMTGSLQEYAASLQKSGKLAEEGKAAQAALNATLEVAGTTAGATAKAVNVDLTKAFENYGGKAGAVFKTSEQLTGSLQAQGISLSKAADEWLGAVASSDKAAVSQKSLREKIEETAKSTEDAKAAAKAHKEALKEQEKGIKEAEKAWEKYTEQQKAATLQVQVEAITKILQTKDAAKVFADYLLTGVVPATVELTGKNRALNEGLAAGIKVVQDLDRTFKDIQQSLTSVGDAVPKVSKAVQDFLDRVSTDASAGPRAIQKAFEEMGVKTVSSLKKAEEDAKRNFEAIKNSGIAAPYEIQQAWVKYLEAQKAAALATGQAWSKEQEKILQNSKDTLAKMEGAVKKSGEKQVGLWEGMAKQVSTIISDLGKDLAKGLWDLLTGKDAASKQNAELRKQKESLTASLKEREDKWEDYQAEVARKMEDLSATYAQTLAEEEAELQSNIAERTADYEDYAEEIADKLAKVRTDNAEDLAKDLDDLKDALEDRRKTYEEYVEDVTDQIEKLRSKFEEDIDEEKRDSNRRAADKATDYQRDYAERERRAAEKRRQYDREVADLEAKIRKEQAKGDKADQEDIAGWRLAIARKTEDWNAYLEELRVKNEEAAQDYRLWVDRETADLDKAIADRTSKYQEEESELKKSLQRRTEAWIEYQEENTAKVEEVIASHAKSLAAEEANLAKSLSDRAAALDEYVVAQMAAYDKAVAKAEASYQKEVSSLQASLAQSKEEWEAYKADTESKLAGIEEQFQGLWDRIAAGFTGVLSSMGQAIVRFGAEFLVGKLFKWLKEDLLGSIFPSLASAASSVFTGVMSAVAGAAEQLAPGMIGVTMGQVGQAAGSAGSVGGTASTAASTGVMGTIGAISAGVGAAAGVVGLFQSARQETTLNAIEESTRYSKIHLGYILEKVNDFLPKNADILDYLYRIQAPALAEVIDEVRGVKDGVRQDVVSYLRGFEGTLGNWNLGNRMDWIWGTLKDTLFPILDWRMDLSAAQSLGSLSAIRNDVGSMLTWDLGNRIGALGASLSTVRPNVTINVAVTQPAATPNQIATAIASNLRTQGMIV